MRGRGSHGRDQRRGDKARVIVSWRNDKPQRAVRSFVLVDLKEALAERVYGDSDDGVGVGIEVGPPAKGLRRDGVLLDLLGPAREALLADVFQYPRQVTRSAKDA